MAQGWVNFVVMIGLFAAACSSEEHPQMDESFGFLISTPGYDVGHAVMVTQQGKYVIGGESRVNSYTQLTRPLIVMTHANGDTVWTLTLSDTASITLLEQSSDDGFIAAGYAYVNNYTMMAAMVIKISADGSVVWKKVFMNYSECASVKSTPDGGYVVLSSGFRNVGGSNQSGLVKLDAMGNIVWEKRYEFRGSIGDFPKALEKVGDGYLLLVNSLDSPTNFFASYLIMTDNNGDTLWTKTLSDEMAFISMFKNRIGQLVLAGNGGTQKYNKTYLLVEIMKLDTVGTILLSNTVNVYYDRLINSIAETKDGQFLLLGNWDQGNGPIVMKFDSSGNWLWSKLYSITNRNYGFSMSLGYQDRFIIVGTSYQNYPSYENSDIFVFTIDANGNVIE